MGLWLRLKKCDSMDACIEHLGLKFNEDKTYKVFQSHITIVPSISKDNIDPDEVIAIVKETVKEVKEELGSGKSMNIDY